MTLDQLKNQAFEIDKEMRLLEDGDGNKDRVLWLEDRRIEVLNKIDMITEEEELRGEGAQV